MPNYEVVIDPFVFYVNVEKDDDIHILRLGSSTFPDCASIHVYGRHKPMAELHGLVFNELCSSNIPLNKKDQGTRKMVTAIIAVTLHLFPHVTHFMFTDTSHIDCDEIKKSVKLTDMYFCVYRQTWYESNFHAYPTFPTKYEALKSAFQQKPHLPFKTIWQHMPKDMKYRSQVQTVYEKSETWHDFFHEWYMIDSCIPFMFLPNILEIVTSPPIMKSLHGTDWVIDARSIDVSNVHIKLIKTSAMPKIQWKTPTSSARRLFGGGMAFSSDLL